MGCQQAEVADDGNKHHSEPEVCWFTACYGRRQPLWSIGCPWPRWEKLSWSICMEIETEWRENLTIVGNITYTFESVFSVCLLFFNLPIFWKQYFPPLNRIHRRDERGRTCLYKSHQRRVIPFKTHWKTSPVMRLCDLSPPKFTKTWVGQGSQGTDCEKSSDLYVHAYLFNCLAPGTLLLCSVMWVGLINILAHCWWKQN